MTQRSTILAALLVGAATLAPISTHAQFGTPAVVTVPGSVTKTLPGSTIITTPGSVTSDQPVELSLTTTIGNWYQPPTSLLGNLNQTLFNGINPQNATQLMPVTQGLPCDSFTPMTSSLAPALAQTYDAAITETQQLTTELQGEDFSTIAANAQAPAVLAAIQANTQVGLAVVSELQFLRAQMAALTLVITSDRLHDLDSDIRPMFPRQGGGC